MSAIINTAGYQSSPEGPDPSLFIRGDFDLPPLPAVAQHLLAKLGSGEASSREIADLIATDVGLVSQIMKIVNSAYYGLPTPIKNVTHAVAYLGLNEIKRVVLTVAVMSALEPDEEEEFEKFWYHSFHTALCAKRIARNFRPGLDSEDLHVAALLHDIGKLVYLKLFPDQYRAIRELSSRQGSLFADAESELGLTPHTELGAALCDRWMLPESVKRACRYHELKHLMISNAEVSPARVGDDLSTIAVANLLSSLATVELSPELKTSIREEAIVCLGCDEEQFLLLMGELYELKSDVGQFLREL